MDRQQLHSQCAHHVSGVWRVDALWSHAANENSERTAEGCCRRAVLTVLDGLSVAHKRLVEHHDLPLSLFHYYQCYPILSWSIRALFNCHPQVNNRRLAWSDPRWGWVTQSERSPGVQKVTVKILNQARIMSTKNRGLIAIAVF